MNTPAEILVWLFRVVELIASSVWFVVALLEVVGASLENGKQYRLWAVDVVVVAYFGQLLATGAFLWLQS